MDEAKKLNPAEAVLYWKGVAQNERKPGEHRWKLSWPGNFCLDCGLDDPMENTDESLVQCPNCLGVGGDLSWSDPPSCETCSGTGCVVNPNLKVPPCPFSPGSAPPAGK